MSSISGSGLDVQGIVSQLMTIERAPIRAIDSKISDVESKISAIGTITSQISALNDSAKKLKDISELGQFSADSTDEDVLTASASGLEVTENHSIQIEALATQHRIASTTTYAETTDSVGAGTHSFTSGDNTFEITLAEGEASLTDLSNAINQSSENTSINASIIHVDDGYRLVLSSRESGSDNTITTDGNWEQLSEAKNATINVDGLTIHPSSNTVSDVIPGVTLNLKSIGTVNLTTGADTDKMTETLQEFATNYNSLQNTLERTASGDLKGEGLSLSIDTALRGQFFQSITDDEGNSKNVFDFGLTFDKDGKLSLNETTFKSAVDSDLYGMLNFFSGDDGFGGKFSTALTSFTESGGTLDSRTDSYNGTISRLESRADRLETRMDKINARYLQTYSTLDALVTQMNSTSSSIYDSLSSLGSD